MKQFIRLWAIFPGRRLSQSWASGHSHPDTGFPGGHVALWETLYGLSTVFPSFTILAFLTFFPLAPFCSLLSPYVTRTRDEDTAIGCGGEARKVCQAEMNTVSRPSLRGMVPSCRSGEPQLMIYGPEGSTESRMAFCKLGRNLNYQKLQHHGLEPCVSGSLLTDQEMMS